MSTDVADNSDDPFFSHVQELLSTIDPEEFTMDEDESQQFTFTIDGEDEIDGIEEKTQHLQLRLLSSNPSSFQSSISHETLPNSPSFEQQLDPFNAQHIEYMQQIVISQYDPFLFNHNNNKQKQSQIQSPSVSSSSSSSDAIHSINISKHEYRHIDAFNDYLSQILLSIIKYAESTNNLFHLHGGNKQKQKRDKHNKRRYHNGGAISYDEIIQHIPPHSHYAFHPALSPAASFTDGVSPKSKIFRSTLMKNQNIEIMDSTLRSISIDHCVDIESLKLIHDILQLCKSSIISVSFHFKLYDETEHELKNNMSSTSTSISSTGENEEHKSRQDQLFRLWQQTHLGTDNGSNYRQRSQQRYSDYNRVKPQSQSLQYLTVSKVSKVNNKHYESNMMISCISSILKLCERMSNLETFDFRLIDFNRECYDHFTHFDINSDNVIFPKLKYLTIHIDDHLSQTEVSSFPFYAFAASPILAFLKKLKSLISISIIIDPFKKRTNRNSMNQAPANGDNADLQQYQFTIYWIKKLCEKIFEILNKHHLNLQEFSFKNIRSDCGTSEFFMEMLVNFIKSHVNLRKLHIILYDLCDVNLSHLVQAIYYTDSKMRYKSSISSLEELKLVSKTCIDYNIDNNMNGNNNNNINGNNRSLRHHYGDIALSALLHLVYNCKVLRSLSLICFYGADTIKFNALMSAIKAKENINHLEIAQLRKDNDTLYSLSKLFKPSHHHHHHHHHKRHHRRLSWNFYESVKISFGVEFGHFYHGEKLELHDMKKLVDLILQNQVLFQRNKQNLLDLISSRIDRYSNIGQIPNDILRIIVEFSLGLDSLNIELLEWNLFDGEELFLLFQTLKYFKEKHNEILFTQHQHNDGIFNKQNTRTIQWFDPNWFHNVIQLDNQ